MGVTTPVELLCDRKWRLKNSLWMLATVAGFGVLTWAAFLYIGVRAKNKAWLAFAGGFFLLVAASLTLSSMYSDGVKGTSSSAGESWSAGLLVLAWFGGIVAALIVRRSWLVWLADHEVNSTPWYGAPPPQTPAPPATPSTAVLDQAVRGGVPPSGVVATPSAPPASARPPSTNSGAPGGRRLEL